MAIQFINRPQGDVLNAFNNAIFEFTSTNLNPSQIGQPEYMNTVRAIVKVDDITIELSAIKNIFYINLKPIITIVFNRNHFIDQVEIPSGNSFLYKDNDLYGEINIYFEITLKNGAKESQTITLNLLKSVEQIVRDEINYDVQQKLKFLLPYTDQTAYAAFWQQYPFEVSIYSDGDRSVKIRDKRTSISTTINLKKGVNRLYFSNGRNLQGFENKIPLLVNHINELEFLIDNEVYATLMLEKFAFDCGTYLKWFNTSGGWSYWKFNPVQIETIQSRTIDTINRDFDNIRGDTRNYSVIGKSVEVSREVKTGMANDLQQELIQTIMRSPKVFIFSNNPYQDLSLKNFKEMKIKDSSMALNNKLKRRELRLQIDLPNQYVQNYGY